MTAKDKILKIMGEQIMPALGCTEPIAVAWCAAKARDNAKGEIVKLVCESSVNIIKNAFAVKIPGTDGRMGVTMAAGIGAVGGDSSMGLEVLKNLKPEHVAEVDKLIAEGKIEATVANNPSKLYVKVDLTTTEGHAVAIIDNGHTNLVFLQKDDEVLIDRTSADTVAEEKAAHDELYSVLSLENIYEFVNNASMEDLAVVAKAIELNTALAEYGLTHECGVCTGMNIKEMIDKGYIALDMASNASMYTSAASDARMAGCPLPAMSNVGSGNQGISCSMPAASTARFLKVSEEKMVRAVAMSMITTIYAKNHLDKLSPVCGVVTAASGSSAGIVYLLDGTVEQMGNAIKNVIGNVAGMFCDGAKGSCGLKVSTGTNAAVHAALLAVNNRFASPVDGIVGADAEETVANFGKLSKEGMNEIDPCIMDIIIKKA